MDVSHSHLSPSVPAKPVPKHNHGANLPHPVQPPPWSILRMTVLARLSAAMVVSAALWGIVLLAMR